MGRIVIAGEPEQPANTLITPTWVERELEQQFIRQGEEHAAMRRVMELRQSVGEPIAFMGGHVGDIVNIRKPERFTGKVSE